jgi:tripartite-type tricarboxylate transporter receptor subunit TctC
MLFVINAGLPARTLGELVALAKANSTKLNYATAGAASQVMLITELFDQRAPGWQCSVCRRRVNYRKSFRP